MYNQDKELVLEAKDLEDGNISLDDLKEMYYLDILHLLLLRSYIKNEDLVNELNILIDEIVKNGLDKYYVPKEEDFLEFDIDGEYLLYGINHIESSYTEDIFDVFAVRKSEGSEILNNEVYDTALNMYVEYKDLKEKYSKFIDNYNNKFMNLLNDNVKEYKKIG